MIEYGKTIRKIRKIKGLTQKQIYLGIVSRSFYSSFEKGIYRVEVSKLLDMLNRLEVSLEEFMYIYNGYQKSNTENIKIKIEKAYNQFNSLELMRIYNSFKDSRCTKERYLAIFAYSLVYLTNKNHLSMSTSPTKEVRNHLISLDIWTLSDIEKYTWVSLTLEKKEKVLFFEKAVTSLSYYEDYDSIVYESLFIEIYSNHIQELLLNGMILEAKNCFKEMKEELIEKKSADFEIETKCCEIVIGLYSDHDHWLEEAKKLLEVTRYINYKNSHMIKSIINTHINILRE